MKTNNPDISKKDASPLDLTPEGVDEAALKTLLEILVAAGKVTPDEVLAAWKLAFVA